MKHSLFIWFSFSGFMVILFFFSCQNNTGINISQPTLVEIERIHPVGEQAAVDLMKKLKGELQLALSSGDIKGAIAVCNLKAIPLTTEIKEGKYNITDLKRISDKYRNPLNAPDSVERLALNYFKSLLAEKQELPGNYVQKVKNGGIVSFNYYKPLFIGGLCLTCHGEQAFMAPDVKAVIDSLYPGDMAVGYTEGDFRGLIKVSIRE